MRSFSVLMSAVLAMSACRSGPSLPGAPFAGSSLLTPLSDAEEAHDALLRADLSRGDSVSRLGPADGISTVLASDVVYLRGGLPIMRGRSAARAIIAAEQFGSGTAIRWQPVRAETSRDGRTGYSYGYSIYGMSAPGAPAIRVDRYIAFWRREEGGWRIAGYAETYGAPPTAMGVPGVAAAAVLPNLPMKKGTGALDAMRDADATFSATANAIGTGQAFGQFAAERAQVFSAPGEFLTGPDEISESFGASSTESSLAWYPVAGEVSPAGDLGFTVGNAVFTGKRDDGRPIVRYSKYLTVWKKQRDGEWRYVVDGGSARPKD